MPQCLACGEQNPEEARFCSACGTALTVEPAVEERKVVSVLFVDLVDFTSRSDQADPEDVRAMLVPYDIRVKSEIESFGGVVEKFIGDAVMAVFGAQVSHGDDAERAVRAGLRVLDAIQELNKENPALDLTVRAAVNTGVAIVDARQQPDITQGLAHGDVVNTASRLQTGAPPGRLVVGAETYYRRVFVDALRAVGAVRSLPDVDASSIAVQGSSQGGGITLAAGGLTNGLVAVMPDVPFLCHFRRAADICDEPPYTEIIRYLAIHRGVGDSAFTTLSYFDGVSFAERASAPALSSVGLMDQVCPPSTVYAAYHAYGGAKGHRRLPVQ